MKKHDMALLLPTGAQSFRAANSRGKCLVRAGNKSHAHTLTRKSCEKKGKNMDASNRILFLLFFFFLLSFAAHLS